MPLKRTISNTSPVKEWVQIAGPEALSWRLDGRRLGFLCRSLLAYRAIERAKVGLGGTP